MKMKLLGFLVSVFGAALSALAGYTRMDFIACQGAKTDASWINTGYTPACTDRIEMKVRFTSYSGTQCLFCSRTGYNSTMTAFFINSSGYKIRYDRGANNQNSYSSKVFTSANDGSVDHLIVYDGNAKKGYVDSSSVDLNTTTSTYTPGSALALFASHIETSGLKDTSSVGNPGNFRFYYCRIYNSSGKLVRNFVPARDDSATAGAVKQCGVYDTVTDTFFTNCGTKAFILSDATAVGTLGPAVTPTRVLSVTEQDTSGSLLATTLAFSNPGFPQRLFCCWTTTTPGGETTNSWEHVDALADVTATETSRTVTAPADAKYVRYFLQPAIPGATAVAYLHSTGTDEYIDTGFTPTSASRADYSFTYDSTASFEFGTPFGSRNANTLQFFVGASKGGNYWFRRYGTQINDSGFGGKPAWAGAHKFSLDHNLYTLDTYVTQMTRADFTCAVPAYVFAVNNNGTAAQFTQIALNSLAIWDDGALVRNYVPCVQADGTPALYDAVNGTFATNAGTTPLTTGAESWSQTETFVANVNIPATAAWTGAGDGKSPTDGANWACTNVLGTALPPTTVPTSETELYIAGNVALDCPTALPHRSVAFGPVTLTADCDWRGLGVLNLTSRIDVAGHTLRVADLSGTDGEITDSTGWTELEGLWAIGGQHIITDVTPLCTDRIETEVRFYNLTSTHCLWCARNDVAGGTMTCFLQGGKLRFDRYYDMSTFATNAPANTTDWMTIVADYATGKVTLNGVEDRTMASGSFTAGSKLCLLASHTTSETTSTGNYLNGFMRSFRLYAADGTLKLDLVARMRNSDSLSGFYDRVSGTFYTSTPNEVRPFTMTSTEGTGTLYIDIPADTVCTNSETGVLLNGGLAVVKEGAGTLYQARQYNHFAGGFRLAAGRVETPVSGYSSTTYSEETRLFGLYGAPFTIDAGATFDGKGNYNFYFHPITLAGTLANTGSGMNSGWGGYALARLAGDATIDVTQTTALGSKPCFTDLGGHTLTVSTVSGKPVYLTGYQTATYTNGTIVLRTGGWLSFMYPCEMRTVNLVQQDGALGVYGETNVRDFTAAYTLDNNCNGTGPLNVYGTFTPVTDYFFGPTLQDGAAIDLSARTNTWSTTSAFSSGCRELTFAKGAAITVKLGTRTPAVGEKIIAWTSLPDATFAWDDPTTHTAAATVGADGLYYGADPNSTVVARAVWTGAANDGNLRNPANWSCANLAGTALADALPGATSAITLGANTTFNFTSAEWLPFVTEPLDAETKSATVCARIAGPLTGANGSPDPYAFLAYPLDDYVYLGAAPLTNLRDATWTAANLATAQLRFEGWFKVTDEQAGEWIIRTGADDYIAVAFDGTWVATNCLHDAVATFTNTVTAGWHRFTVIRGDTGGGYTSKVKVNDVESVLGVSINGGAEVAFEDAFTFGSGAVFSWYDIDTRGCTLGADCNWCALAEVPIDDTLDLNGHTLRVNGLATLSGSVTNSSETLGTLAVGVAARATGANSALTLAGNARLVKDGEGTFKMAKGGQLFTGGVDVLAGTLEAGVAGTTLPFGVSGGEIRVAPAGAFNLAAQVNWQDYSVRLAGGVLRNSSDSDLSGNGFSRITLDADSSVTNCYNTILLGGTSNHGVLDLNGHTLMMSITSGKYAYLTDALITNGTIRAVSGGYLVFGAYGGELADATLVAEDCALMIKNNWTIDNYVAQYTKNYSSTTAGMSFHVTGTFKPDTDYFETVYLVDGATLDLSARTTAFPITSKITDSCTHSCSFAMGAKITVDCHGRTLAAGQKLVEWSGYKQGVDFLLDAESAAALGGNVVLVQKADGLYIDSALTWKGGDGDVAELANWQTVDGGTPTTLHGATLDVGGTVALTSAQKLKYVYTKMRVKGTASFTEPGGLCISTLEVGATGRIVIDPLAYTLRFMGAPTFVEGAKIALSSNYATKTKGRFLLATWSDGTIDPAVLANLFDTTSTAAGATATLTQEVTEGARYLWLDLAPTVAKPTVNMLFLGDSVIRGDTTSANCRIPAVKELEADGYAVETKGFWQNYPYDLCDMTMPAAWSRHSADGYYALVSNVNYPGYLDAIANVLEQAGDVDFVVCSVGAGDIVNSGLSVEETVTAWTNFVAQILVQKPHAKVLALNLLPRVAFGEECAACNVRFAQMFAQGAFDAQRVKLVDVAAQVPLADTENWLSSGALSRNGSAKVGAAIATAARAAIAADASWQTGVAEAVVVSSGAEANVPAAERAGFTRARVYDVAAHSGTALRDGISYDVEDAGVTENIGRVAWYVEMKRPNGSTRWLWAAVDAWGTRTIDQVGVPVRSGYSSNQPVSRLRVKTNMPGIAETADGAYDRGAVKFTCTQYWSAPAVNNVMPDAGWGLDWNDTLTSGSFGAMSLHRFTPAGFSKGEVLFGFNGWKLNRSWDMGLGGFANRTISSTDWTFSGAASTDAEIAASMGVEAYEVARIEIWTMPETLCDQTVATALWTNGAGDGDLANAANWSCTNIAGAVVLNGVPDAGAKVRFEGTVDIALADGVEYAEIALGNMTLACDLDLRGRSPVKVVGTVDLNGHKLYLDQLVGGGNVTDTTEFDLTTTDSSKVTSSTTFHGGVAANLFNNNFARNGTDNTRRVIVANKNLPMVVDYNFGTPTTIDGYRVFAGPQDTGGDGRGPKVWTLEGSNDGENWTVVDSRGGIFWPMEQQGRIFSLSTPATYSRFRFKVTEAVIAGNGYMEFVQLEYGLQSRLGELHVDVANGRAAQNSDVKVDGQVRFFKDGEGALTLAKTAQYFWSFSATEGVAKLTSGVSGYQVGRSGAEVKVEPHATLDLCSAYGLTIYSFVLNGGTLKNSVSLASRWTKEMISYLALGADSTVDFNGYGFLGHSYRSVMIDPHGHTLTLKNSGDLCYFANTYVRTGTIKLNGTWEVYKNGVLYAPDVRWEVSGLVNMNSATTMGEYIDNSTSGALNYSAKLTVLKRFMPNTDHYRGCTLGDGVVIDLTGRTTTLTTPSQLTGSCTQTNLAFTANASYTVDLSGRTLKSGDRVIGWETASTPANYDTSTFAPDATSRRDGIRLVKKEDGIYVRREHTIIFLR